MSFSNAARLWLLVVPAAFAVGYVVTQVLRHRVAARFAEPALLPSVLPVRAPWQRHLAAAGLSVALVLLATGVAGPRTVSQQPRKAAIVVFAIDTSTSMGSTDVAPTRLDAARTATKSLVAALPATFRAGVVTFGTVPDLLVSPTLDRRALAAALDTLTPAHATATAGALQLALDAIKQARAQAGPMAASIVLVSDGSPSVGLNGQSPQQAVDTEAAAAKAAKVTIDTVACGTTTGAATLARIAGEAGGASFTARNAAQLTRVFSKLGTVIGKVKKAHDLTAWFTGVALLMGCATAAAGLRWSNRLL